MPALMGATPSGTFTTKASLQTAVRAYNGNPDAATATYGSIAGWDVSMITDMSHLFYLLTNFNADISSWDTSKVTTMYTMFHVRPAHASGGERIGWRRCGSGGGGSGGGTILALPTPASKGWCRSGG
jgi:surface protein